MLTGKVIVVTGATGALGRAMVDTLLAANASVGIVGGRAAGMERLLDGLQTAERVSGHAADLTDERQTAEAVAAVAAHFGGLDGLVATAGGFGGGKPVHETALVDWQRQQEIHLTTVFLTCKAIAPHLIQRGGGAIVTIGSRPALRGTPNLAAYSVAKGGVDRGARWRITGARYLRQLPPAQHHRHTREPRWGLQGGDQQVGQTCRDRCRRALPARPGRAGDQRRGDPGLWEGVRMRCLCAEPG